MIGSVLRFVFSALSKSGWYDFDVSSNFGLFEDGFMISSKGLIWRRLLARRFIFGGFSTMAASFLGEAVLISETSLRTVATGSNLTSLAFLRGADYELSSIALPCSLQARQNHLSRAFFFMSNFLSAL
jgi:hypothetical protein